MKEDEQREEIGAGAPEKVKEPSGRGWSSWNEAEPREAPAARVNVLVGGFMLEAGRRETMSDFLLTFITAALTGARSSRR